MDEFITILVNLWFQWLANDKKARDTSLTLADRRLAAERCEAIVNEKYKIITKIDEVVDGYKRT